MTQIAIAAQKPAAALSGEAFEIGDADAKPAELQAQTARKGASENGAESEHNDCGFSVYEPSDPLADLVVRCAADPGAPFKPDVLDALAELRTDDRAAFEALRAALKAAKVRVSALDQAISAAAGTDNDRQTQADLLLEIAAEAALFHTGDKTAFADIVIAGHRETWPVKSKGFRRWLGRAFYEKHGGAPNGDAVQSALAVVEAKAHYDAPERAIYLRIGEHDGKLYLDLGDESWRAIEIDADRWRIIAEPPVRFRRAAGMLALPEPTRGGSLDALRKLVNVGTDQDFILAIAWLLATFRPRGPYPVLIVAGEQGSAKSTFITVLRSLIDPNTSPLRSLPREDRDLFIAANNGHVLSFDNVSGLPGWISDTLCRLATGGGFAVRTLYSDSDETLFEAMRPIALNGIEDIVSRPDLAERGLFLTLTAIPETARRTDKAVTTDLDAARPAILGALLDAVSAGLRRLPETNLNRLPRMADFAMWATACGDGTLWPAGGFMEAHDANRASAINDVIENDPVANAIRGLVDGEARTAWTGSAQHLLAALREIAGENVAKGKAWPESARALSARVTRAATFLRSIGIEIERYREGHAKTRMLEISSADNRGKLPSAPSAPSAMADFRHFSADGSSDPTVHRPSAPSADRPHRPQTVRSNPLKTNGAGDADGADAKIPTQTGSEKNIVPGGWI
ncbi:hypothetical protein [Acidiphilium iwatense]|uniref:ATP-binding protein n=1 Tax=Acidiphilium iwatense TaxID=768198 RepID=A0ABS9DYF9_9PROT|nr:hypothetical protein [Acidiphilium iwatense]MCF3947794.1 hypothetical protein [Acidiphilium iwatense]